jgi:hypothetical protein
VEHTHSITIATKKLVLQDVPFRRGCEEDVRTFIHLQLFKSDWTYAFHHYRFKAREDLQPLGKVKG